MQPYFSCLKTEKTAEVRSGGGSRLRTQACAPVTGTYWRLQLPRQPSRRQASMSFSLRRQLRHSPSRGSESPQRGDRAGEKALQGHKAGAGPTRTQCETPPPGHRTAAAQPLPAETGARALPPRLRGVGRVSAPAQCVGHRLPALLRSSFLSG